MQTLLVPTDFSDAALHAAIYACRLAEQYNFKRIVLYHNYQVIVPATGIPLMVYDNDNSLYQQNMQQLAEVRESLYRGINHPVNIDIMTESGFLPENINSVSKKEMVDLIVMGVKGKSNVEKILIGSNTIKVIDQSKAPVLMVPYRAPLAPIHTVLFACDLKKVTETIHIDLLSRFLDTFHAKLYVLNVDDGNKHFSQNTPIEISHLNQMLDKYQPEYHFINDKDVVSGIMHFAKEQNASIVITVPKKHGIFHQLFHRSISEKLIYHTHIPLLCLHE